MNVKLDIEQTFISDYPPSFSSSLGYSKNIWENSLSLVEHFAFFFHMVIETIDSCLGKDYINFDAQTTSNCCHGLSILTRDLILSVNQIDLLFLKDK